MKRPVPLIVVLLVGLPSQADETMQLIDVAPRSDREGPGLPKPLTSGTPTHVHAESKCISVKCPTFPSQRNSRHILQLSR